MKTLSEKASQIFSALLALNQSMIDNGKFMPVHIEVFRTVNQFKEISIAHYGSQNGDLMRDPEMVIIYDTKTGDYIPSYYRNDYAGIESFSAHVDNGYIVVRNEKIQADHTDFANQWLMNIAEQQHISI